MTSGSLARRRLDPECAQPSSSLDENRREQRSLAELLNETRILLPGTQVFLGFLTMLPFTERFETLSPALRTVYVWTFFANLLALACFVAPAAYHRIARPIHHKDRFKILASRFLVIGLAPFSSCVVLATYLVTSVVLSEFALAAATAMAIVVAALWWVIPAVRLHDRLRPLDDRRNRKKKEQADGEMRLLRE